MPEHAPSLPDLSEFTITPEFDLIRNGQPINRLSEIKVLYYVCRRVSEEQPMPDIEAFRHRLELAWVFSLTALEKLPSEEFLDSLFPVIPERPPKPPKKKPKQAEALSRWLEQQKKYEMYPSALPEMQRLHELWIKTGGENGRKEIELLSQKLSRLTSILEARMKNPDRLMAQPVLTLPFEIVPAGQWNQNQLIQRLTKSTAGGKQMVPERLDHLNALNPTAVYAGITSSSYREYFVFLFGEDRPAVLESPIHGNATYLISRDWRKLCQRTKNELRHHPDVTAIIHNDMDDWKRGICTLLHKPLPRHSNEY